MPIKPAFDGPWRINLLVAVLAPYASIIDVKHAESDFTGRL